MVKCTKQKCFHVKADLQCLSRNYSIEKYENCFQNQNVYRKLPRMTDGMKTSEHELKVNNWEGFHNWLYCICVVTFDLELGQALEVLFHCINNVQNFKNIFFRVYIHNMCPLQSKKFQIFATLHFLTQIQVVWEIPILL